jgi:hypothetical protein
MLSKFIATPSIGILLLFLTVPFTKAVCANNNWVANNKRNKRGFLKMNLDVKLFI